MLVGSPVYQKPEILRLFLASLENLVQETVQMDYLFVDDNADKESSGMLAAFAQTHPTAVVLQGKEAGAYHCTEESHLWNDSLMLKVARYKNTIIQHALDKAYDFLFFVDSDLILHPLLAEYLKSLDKEIVSEIFWSQWHDDRPLEPNVWLFDEYDLVPKALGESPDEKEQERRQARFFQKLQTPGTYPVGGLGACTLLSQKALRLGVNFEPIYNLTIHGEDRFFCIRAAVLGLALFVDTHYHAYHIYRERDLEGVAGYVQENSRELTFARRVKKAGNKITLTMLVKNEENRYLRRVLGSLREHIDAAVIIDDGSTDGTAALCRTLLEGVPLTLVQNEKTGFDHESEARRRQWEETVKTNPDWVLNLDGDELPEAAFWDGVQEMMDDETVDSYSFRLYDMWNETQYREDAFWNAHLSYKTFLMRYQPEFPYVWPDRARHAGRFAGNAFALQNRQSSLRIQHLGWSTEKDRLEKYRRYREIDPDAVYGVREQYESILDTDAHLVNWTAGAADDR